METTRTRGISAAVLKNVAVITMTIDHVTAFILKEWLRSQGILNAYASDWYYLGRVIGRIAFVLYAFMIAEGAARTHNKARYALRLLALAVISIVPHSYVNTGKWFNPNSMNIFFLLFLGLITIYAIQWLRARLTRTALYAAASLAVTAASCAVSLLLHFEYGMMGILLILAFYVSRGYFLKTAVLGTLVMSLGYMANVILSNNAVAWISGHSSNLLNAIINTDRIQIFGLLAFPFIYFYNGQKGRQLPKAFYYFFYPVHLMLIALIVQWM